MKFEKFFNEKKTQTGNNVNNNEPNAILLNFIAQEKIKLQQLISQFIQNSYNIISENPNINISKEVYADKITEEISDVVRQKKVYTRFCAGAFDKDITNKTLTEDLKVIIKSNNMAFVERLFVECTNQEMLKFWLEQGAKLPADAVAIALIFKSKKPVFEFLNKNGWFNDVTREDVDEIMERAKKRLDQETIKYLQEIFCKKNSEEEKKECCY